MRSYPFASMVLLSLAFMTYFYGPLLLSPNQHLFGAENDALKSYYATAYHIKNDSSYLNFQGMNYPYGENILYTDCQPVLANSLKVLGTFHPFFIHHSIGILNLLMLLGIFGCSIVVYFLLKELYLDKDNFLGQFKPITKTHIYTIQRAISLLIR